jgi:hypothetical protein
VGGSNNKINEQTLEQLNMKNKQTTNSLDVRFPKDSSCRSTIFPFSRIFQEILEEFPTGQSMDFFGKLFNSGVPAISRSEKLEARLQHLSAGACGLGQDAKNGHTADTPQSIELFEKGKS